MATNTYGDIGDRTAAYAVRDFLARAIPVQCLEQFGQTQALPSNSTKTLKFRRFNALNNTPIPLVEGVAPTGTPLTTTDVTLTLTQYAGVVELTDVIMDTHEDPVLQQAIEVLGEQAGQVAENIRYAALKACSNVFYNTGVTGRSSITSSNTLDANLQAKVVKALKRQNAKPITKALGGTVKYGMVPVQRGYIAICHPDLEESIRTGLGSTFTSAELYGTMTPYENEIGKSKDVRYLLSTMAAPYIAAGSGGIDVYPILYIGADAFATCALRGAYAAEMFVANPRPIPGLDPVAQKGSAGWKTMQGCVILNDLFMAVAEVAAPTL